MSVILHTGGSITCVVEVVLKNLQLKLIKHESMTHQITSSTETLDRVRVQLTIGHTMTEVQLHVLCGMRKQLLLGIKKTRIL